MDDDLLAQFAQIQRYAAGLRGIDLWVSTSCGQYKPTESA